MRCRWELWTLGPGSPVTQIRKWRRRGQSRPIRGPLSNGRLEVRLDSGHLRRRVEYRQQGHALATGTSKDGGRLPCRREAMPRRSRGRRCAAGDGGRGMGGEEERECTERRSRRRPVSSVAQKAGEESKPREVCDTRSEVVDARRTGGQGGKVRPGTSGK